jgi:3-carboxy-cis,cis-muconate cycloisomerase
MRRNLDATGGVIFAERLVMALAPKIGRARATVLVKTAVAATAASGRPLAEEVAASPELASLLDSRGLADVFDATTYLGSAEVFRVRLRAAATLDNPRKR